MSSNRSSYGSSYGQDKGYTRPSTSSSYGSTSTSTSSIYANSAQSSRNYRYGSKPPVVHNGGGQINDPNTSTSAGNGSYHQ